MRNQHALSWILFFLVGIPRICEAFLVPVRTVDNRIQASSKRVFTRETLRFQSVVPLSLDGSEKTGDDEDNMILPSMFVGTVAASVGFLYAKSMSASVQLLWEKFPGFLASKLQVEALNTIYFLPAMVTFGGFLIGLLSSKFSNMFAVSDFVKAFSKRTASTLPSSKVNLIPVLILSLMTSAFGFSKGPEAPMVCAGGLIGASMSRWIYGKNEEQTNPEEAKRHQETLAYAGAAGTLTAFMGIPIAGSIFALEMTRPNVALHRSGERQNDIKKLSPMLEPQEH